jgi:hypothetical protein
MGVPGTLTGAGATPLIGVVETPLTLVLAGVEGLGWATLEGRLS